MWGTIATCLVHGTIGQEYSLDLIVLQGGREGGREGGRTLEMFYNVSPLFIVF